MVLCECYEISMKSHIKDISLHNSISSRAGFCITFTYWPYTLLTSLFQYCQVGKGTFSILSEVEMLIASLHSLLSAELFHTHLRGVCIRETLLSIINVMTK